MRHLKKRIILAFIDNELIEKQRKKAEDHLSSCRECQIQKKLIMDERQLVKERIDLLIPERTSQIRSFAFDRKKAEIYIKPFFKRIILASVKVPTVLLILTGVTLLTMSLLLFTKKAKPTISEKRYEKQKAQITLIYQDSMTSFPINVELTGFRPISNPKLLVTGRYK